MALRIIQLKARTPRVLRSRARGTKVRKLARKQLINQPGLIRRQRIIEALQQHKAPVQSPKGFFSYGEEVATSFHRLLESVTSDAASRLEKLLADPIKWQNATKATRDVIAHSRLIPAKPAQSHQFNSQWPGNMSKTFGISRDGFTCYRLGALQALLHAPVFVNWLLGHHCANSKSDCLACALKGLAGTYWSDSRDKGKISARIRAVHSLASSLGKKVEFKFATPNIHTQGDPLEFINWIFGYFLSWRPHPMPVSQLNELFAVTAVRSRVCRICGSRQDPMRDTNHSLGLRLVGAPKRITFSQLVERAFADEDITCKCNKCKVDRHMFTKTHLSTAPKVLLVHIDRTDYFRGAVKIGTAVDFPTKLDLSRYATNALLQEHGQPKYELSAVVSHSGSAKSGHYVATTKCPEGVFFVNDDHVSAGSFKSAATGSIGYDAVLLMYLRV